MKKLQLILEQLQVVMTEPFISLSANSENLNSNDDFIHNYKLYISRICLLNFFKTKKLIDLTLKSLMSQEV
jgi:hypothetical protein